MKIEHEWKILIVDEFGMKVLSSCFKTEEVMSFNIALIESLEMTREPLPYLSAIYLLFPSVQNIGYLQTDFVSVTPKYRSVHLYFLSTVPSELFKELHKYTTPGLVETFREIDFLFLPYESQVFSLNDDRFFSIFFDAYKELDVNYCTLTAKKLATLCATLKTKPRIRYRRHFVKNFILAQAVENELGFYHDMFSSICEIDRKPRCELLILDRGFDCISPVVHEVTLQAMVYDLLDIEDDIFSFPEDEKNSEKVIEISLTEADSLWCKLRHEHIANVTKVLEGMFETNLLLRQHPKLARFKKIPELGNAMRQYLANRRNQPQAIYRRMANECMKLYCEGVNVLSEIEQELAICSISEKTMKDARSSVLNILRNETYSITEKLRLLLLYIFFSKGVTKQEFDDIMTSCELPFSDARIITNVLHLDVDIFRPGFCKSVDYIQKPEQDSTSMYKQSKWRPAVKNVMLSCIDGSLSQEKYPYLDNVERDSLIANKRSGYWCRDKKAQNMSCLIVFIAGGITCSEMRSAYEVMVKYKGWEIYIGGDSILTPKKFLKKLEELRCFITKDM